MEEHAKKIPLAEGQRLVETSMQAKGSRKGRDVDIYDYDVVNEAGEVVAKYEVEDSMSIYPPFGRTITVTKLG